MLVALRHRATMSSTSPLTFSGFEVQQQSWKRVAVKKRDSLLSRELAGKEHKAGAVFFDACDTDEGSDDDYSDDCCSHSHSSSQSSSSSSLPIPKPTSRYSVISCVERAPDTCACIDLYLTSTGSHFWATVGSYVHVCRLCTMSPLSVPPDPFVHAVSHAACSFSCRLAVMYYQARFQLQQAHLQEVHGAAVVQQDKVGRVLAGRALTAFPAMGGVMICSNRFITILWCTYGLHAEACSADSFITYTRQRHALQECRHAHAQRRS